VSGANHGIFDPAPLLARFHGLNDTEIGCRLGVAASTVGRWRSGDRKIHTRLADEIAVKHLGLHPALVWPEWWERAS
jgi:hypothetical protein